MTIKRKPWLVYDTTEEAREEAWKVAHQEGIKIGEAVNKMLLEYGYLKACADANMANKAFMSREQEVREKADKDFLYRVSQENIRQNLPPSNQAITFYGNDEDEINKKIILWQMNFLRKQGGLEPLPAPRDKSWWKFWG